MEGGGGGVYGKAFAFGTAPYMGTMDEGGRKRAGAGEGEMGALAALAALTAAAAG